MRNPLSLPALARRSLALVLCVILPARAGDVTFNNGGSGNWNDINNWDTGAVPVNGDRAFLPARLISYAVTFDGGYVGPGLGLLTIDGGVSFLGHLARTTTLSQAANNMYASREIVGDTGNGLAVYSQTGGNNTISGALYLGNNAGIRGNYVLDNTGNLQTASEYVGYSGVGVFDQNNGLNTVSGTLALAYSPNSTGTYNLKNGILLAGTVIVGDDSNTVAAFNQSGGGASITGNLSLASFSSQSQGSYALSGDLSVGGNVLVGDKGSGTFVQTGGTHTIGGDLHVAEQASSYGDYQLQGGTLTLSSANGKLSVGTGSVTGGFFEQTGGSAKLNGFLVLGDAVSTIGIYTMSGAASTLTVSNQEIIGEFGTGSFTQNDGTHTANSYIRLGDNAGSVGVFTLNGGQLNAKQLVAVGVDGSGSFTQNGGAHVIDPAGQLQLGLHASGSGAYTLHGGSLTAPSELIGMAGFGSILQDGGTNAVSDFISIPFQPGGTGNYELDKGMLAAGRIFLNAGGTFTQVAGVNGATLNATNFYHNGGTVQGTLQNQGTFTYNSGTFAGRLLNQGNIVLNADFTAANGMENDSTITLPAGRNVTLNGTHGLENNGSITLNGQLAVAGYDAIGGSAPGTFIQNGGAHTSTVSLLLGVNAAGTYTLNDGTLTTNLGYFGDGANGHFIQNGGTYTSMAPLSIGHFANAVYDLNGGNLIVNANEQVGEYPQGVGTINQIGGTHTVANALTLGALQVGSNGAYNLAGGTLTVKGAENIGNLGAGAFNQSGGNHDVSAAILYLGVQTGGQGSYTLGGTGQLHAAQEIIGDGGTGSFVHNNGTNTVAGNLFIGFANGSTGSYAMHGGKLSAGTNVVMPAYIGYLGNGTFTQDGGTVEFSSNLSIGDGIGSNGSYVLSNGSLSVLPINNGGREIIGNDGTGSFTQTGGTHSVAFNLNVGFFSDGTGTYNLSNTGALSVGGDEVVGVEGSGTFNQTGGTNSMGNNLIVGNDTNGVGVYNLTGGTLSPGRVFVGFAGNATGTFNQDGGVNTVGGGLYVGFKGAHGTYNLKSGTLSVQDESIGLQGTGVFNQTGGTHMIANTLAIYGAADFNGSNGSFLLKGGNLTAGPVTNNGTFTQSGGVANVGAVDGLGAVSVAGPGILNADHIRQSSLAIGGGGLVNIRPSGADAALSTVSVLNIAGAANAWTGTLNLADNDLIVHATPATADAVLQQITNQIKTARTNGTWMGNGITSSAAAADLKRLTGLAIIRNQKKDQNGNLVPIYNTYEGLPVDMNTILVKYTWNGDMNLDGIVNFDDYFLINTGFLSNGALTGYRWGDLNFDGVINFDDYFLLNSAFLGQGNTILSAAGLSSEAVPEPGMTGLALLGTCFAAFARRRR